MSHSTCFIFPRGEDRLELRAEKDQFANFKDGMVATVGIPGSGKSTINSAIYNVMRNTYKEYFARSASTESFTKGMWVLRNDEKVLLSKADVIDTIDVEGLEESHASRFMIVASMTLVKAVLFCNKGNRFNKASLATFIQGVRLLKAYNIKLPKPILYVEVKFGCTTVQVNTGMLSVAQYMDYVKSWYPELAEYIIKPFSVPDLAPGTNPINDPTYRASVRQLVDDLARIPNGEGIDKRLQYLHTVVGALNANSPEMVIDLNFAAFKTACAELKKRIESDNISAIISSRSAGRIESYVTYSSWAGGDVNLHNTFEAQAKQIPYYMNTPRFNNYVSVTTCSVTPHSFLDTVYKRLLGEYELATKAHGDQIAKDDNDRFRKFVEATLQSHACSVPFRGSTTIPHSVLQQISARKAAITAELRSRYPCYKPPVFYLDINVNNHWDSHVSALQRSWDATVERAKWCRKITVSGNCECKQCGKNHNNNISHKGCAHKLTKQPYWHWVDYPTRYAVCSGCEVVRVVSSCCCWNCDTTLDVSLNY